VLQKHLNELLYMKILLKNYLKPLQDRVYIFWMDFKCWLPLSFGN